MRTTTTFQDPVSTPEFDDLVRELDELIREDFRREMEPALEDLFLARLGRREEPATWERAA